MAYFIGVDIGGTNLKSGVVDDNGIIISESSIPTGADRPQDIVLQDIISIVKDSIKTAKLTLNDIKAIGLGSPGSIDTENGIVIYNGNLGWRDFHITQKITEALNIPAGLENDADAAALGEVVSGSAKGAKSALIITLGTGVGTGLIINEKIFRGCEFGHMVIIYEGRQCTCGRKGCFETYCSATGLINSTKEAIEKYPDSILAQTAKESGKVEGRTVFDARDKGCSVSEKVIDDYISYLACGIANLVNGLQPEVVSIGGGIAKQNEKLLVPLREKVNQEIFKGITPPKIVTCTLGYKAGLIGAAMSVRDL